VCRSQYYPHASGSGRTRDLVIAYRAPAWARRRGRGVGPLRVAWHRTESLVVATRNHYPDAVEGVFGDGGVEAAHAAMVV
jgi:hypothetical protein